MSSSPAALEVLVVDDDEGCREMTAEVVERLGHHCRTAMDGNDALAQLAAHPADVIVSDWDMPGMDGLELCRRTRRSSNDEPYVYFIMVTAVTNGARFIGAMAAGADDFQRKPVNIDELEGRLTSAARVVQLHRKLAART